LPRHVVKNRLGLLPESTPAAGIPPAANKTDPGSQQLSSCFGNAAMYAKRSSIDNTAEAVTIPISAGVAQW
jgi:hypothetical protein